MRCQIYTLKTEFFFTEFLFAGSPHRPKWFHHNGTDRKNQMSQHQMSVVEETKFWDWRSQMCFKKEKKKKNINKKQCFCFVFFSLSLKQVEQSTTQSLHITGHRLASKVERGHLTGWPHVNYTSFHAMAVRLLRSRKSSTDTLSAFRTSWNHNSTIQPCKMNSWLGCVLWMQVLTHEKYFDWGRTHLVCEDKVCPRTPGVHRLQNTVEVSAKFHIGVQCP